MRSCEIELKAEKAGATIRRTDAMIASIAINHRALLYTLDLRHFQPLQTVGLRLFPL